MTAKDVIREDAAFWDITAPMHKTYRLTLEAEYQDEGLDKKTFKEHGFKGGRSLQHPMKLKNHPDLQSGLRQWLFKWIRHICQFRDKSLPLK